jgi:hypothetical protein
VCGVWVLLGIGSLVGRATERQTEHRVEVHGAVAHVVVPAEVTMRAQPVQDPQGQQRLLVQPPASEARRQDEARRPVPPRKRMIECPRCSMLIGTTATACSCGWVVPVPAIESSKPQSSEPAAVESAATPPATTNAKTATRSRVCPACPQCRASAVWNAEFERFYCSRCDARVESIEARIAGIQASTSLVVQMSQMEHIDHKVIGNRALRPPLDDVLDPLTRFSRAHHRRGNVSSGKHRRAQQDSNLRPTA